jgi:hypothetical protein
MSQMNSFLNSKGKANGCTLIAVKRDPHQNCDLSIYYIGLDAHVGVVAEGITAWISSVQQALFTLFAKDELATLVAKAKAGEVIEVIPTALPRKRPALHDLEKMIVNSVSAFEKSGITSRKVLTGRAPTSPVTQSLPLQRKKLNHV